VVTNVGSTSEAVLNFTIPRGSQLLSGAGVPITQGANNDYYLDTQSTCLYGPKAAGGWGTTCVPLGGMAWRNNWVSGATYYLNDVVYYEGSSYRCVAPVTGSVMSPNVDPTHWAPLALSGSAGLPPGVAADGANGLTVNGDVTANSFQGANSDPFMNFPSNENHIVNTAGDVWRIGANLFFFDGTAAQRLMFSGGNQSFDNLTINQTLTVDSITSGNSDPFISFPSNALHVASPGDLWRDGASLKWNDGSNTHSLLTTGTVGTVDSPGGVKAVTCSGIQMVKGISNSTPTCADPAGASAAMTAWSNPRAWGNTVQTWQVGTANQVRLMGLLVDTPLTCTNLDFVVYTADTNTADFYDVAIFDPAGNTKLHCGPVNLTTTGYHTCTSPLGQVALAPGKYYVGYTGTATTAALALSKTSGVGNIQFLGNVAGSTNTSSGTFGTTYSPIPADAYGLSEQAVIGCH
jgi:hypothetical protein